MARLDPNNAEAQPVNSARRDMWSASAPMGNCSTASPTTTVLTMNNAISVLKPCCRQYIGSRVRIMASNEANNAMAQAITGSLLQKANRSAKVTFHACVEGAPPRPSNSKGDTSSRPVAAQKPKSSSDPSMPSTNGPASWLSA